MPRSVFTKTEAVESCAQHNGMKLATVHTIEQLNRYVIVNFRITIQDIKANNDLYYLPICRKSAF